MEHVFPVMEVLFVFGKWTLMMDATQCAGLGVGASVDLLDEAGRRLGEATICAFMRTQNPAIQPISLERKADPADFKQVKAVRLQRA
jgi:hypothetical protein